MNFRRFLTTKSWWGKLLGAFFGYLILGPVGALFGILIGNFFDRGLASHFANVHWLFYSEKRSGVQQIFFETTFLVMGYIAKADGRVSEQEIEMARAIMGELRLNRMQRHKAKLLFNEGKYLPNLEQILIKLHAKCYDNPGLLRLFIDIQYRTAQVGGLSAEKIKVLDNLLMCLGFASFQKQQHFYENFSSSNQSSSSNKQYNHQSHSKFNNTYSSNLTLAYNLLGVPLTATKQEVKRAYRRLLSLNHPDKLIAQNQPEAKIKLANEKTQKIVKAYEVICESQGW